MFERAATWLREVMGRVLGKQEIGMAAGIDLSAVTDEMQRNIRLWFDIFERRAPWVDKKTLPVHLAVYSTAYLARLVNCELKLEISGSARGDYLNEQLQRHVLPRIDEATQLALVGGQSVLKPYVQGREIAVELVRADRFYPAGFDAAGRTTAAIFVERKTMGHKVYTRLEHHSLEVGGRYQVTNSAYCGNGQGLGRRVPLAEVEGWSGLLESAHIDQVERPLFACLRMPFANNIDGSFMPISLYANAVRTLEALDRTYTAYQWEIDSGRRKLMASEMAFQTDPTTGAPRGIPDDLFVGLTLPDPDKMFEDYTPQLRVSSYQEAINQHLRTYEAQIGVSPGTYSLDLRTGDVTATEVLAQDRNTYNTVRQIQVMERAALLDLLYAMDVWADAYQLAPRGSYETVAEFGDSVFEDTQTEFLRRMQLVSMGMRPELLLSWYFGVTEEQARDLLGDMTQLAREPGVF